VLVEELVEELSVAVVSVGVVVVGSVSVGVVVGVVDGVELLAGCVVVASVVGAACVVGATVVVGAGSGSTAAPVTAEPLSVSPAAPASA
jgi:hypothetical protein